MSNEYNEDQAIVFDMLRYDLLHVADDLESITYNVFSNDKVSQIHEIAADLRKLESRLASVTE